MRKQHLLTRAGRFRRRMFVIGAAQAAAIGGIGSRLYFLQLVQSEKYRELADKNRIRKYYIPPSRGRLVDRNGAVLARNRLYYRLFRDVGTEALSEERQAALYAELVRLLKPSPLLAEALKAGVARAAVPPSRRRTGEPEDELVIADGLTRRQASAIEVRRHELPGLYVRKSYRRYYPFAEAAGHITGYIGAPDEKEVKTKPELRVPGMQTGKNGAERAFEEAVHGEAGRRFVETDAKSRAIRELERFNGVPGEDVTLTLDMRLQTFIHEEFRKAGKNGCVTVLDAETGAVMAYVSAPGYDPNLFTGGISRNDWRLLTENPSKPLVNRPVSSQYPPGSTFKPCVGLAAMQAGLSPHKRFYCPGHFKLGNRRFHCWKTVGHGWLDLHGAIQQSCNVYFYNVAKMIGSEPIIRTARALGLGAPSGIAMPNEAGGLIPDDAWKRARKGYGWMPGDTINMSIGQGDVLTTPLQLAVMAAGIAGGKRVTPFLSGGARHEPHVTAPPPLPEIDEAALDYIRNAMRDVVNRKRGTAYRHRIEDTPFSFAGKTGTVQVISKKARKRLEAQGNAALLARTEHHGLFIGYAPIAKPKAAFSIVVEHGGSGSGSAAPFAKNIAEKIRQLYFDGAPV